MRRAFCDGMVALCDDPDLVFLTGDLGFNALEPLRDRLAGRFINAGVAEQNMVGCGAGLARAGFRPWLYSIAPFLYARAFEQIRNDVCLHNLPVVLVGNGGGYGYGVMGATHHAIEDYGVLLSLQDMRVFIPAFDSDLAVILPGLQRSAGPAYLRLGLQAPNLPEKPPSYQVWRKLLSGKNGLLISVGPLAGFHWQGLSDLSEVDRPTIWCLAELPIRELPDVLLQDIRRSGLIVFAEEHVACGSAGREFSQLLLQQKVGDVNFVHLTAKGYPSGRYGSQVFHRTQSGLDEASVRTLFGA